MPPPWIYARVESPARRKCELKRKLHLLLIGESAETLTAALKRIDRYFFASNPYISVSIKRTSMGGKVSLQRLEVRGRGFTWNEAQLHQAARGIIDEKLATCRAHHGPRTNDVRCRRSAPSHHGAPVAVLADGSSCVAMSYDRKQIILERSELSEGLGGKYVDLYEFPDGRLEVRSNGHTLPYRVFSKDQRVSHTCKETSW